MKDEKYFNTVCVEKQTGQLFLLNCYIAELLHCFDTTIQQYNNYGTYPMTTKNC